MVPQASIKIGKTFQICATIKVTSMWMQNGIFLPLHMERMLVMGLGPQKGRQQGLVYKGHKEQILTPQQFFEFCDKNL